MGSFVSSRSATRRLVAALVLVVIAAASCADDGSDRAATATTSTEPRPTTTEAAQAADVAPVPSAGCGSTQLSAGETKVTTTSAGQERWYFLHVPPAHDGSTPVPLVLDLHGYGEGAEVHLAMSALGSFGDAEGFVTVTPQGQGTATTARWDLGADSIDLTYVGDLLDEVEADACIDLARVYATGLSNGAFLTSAIACRFADRIAAVAPVAGLLAIDGCAPSRPVPVIAFHGTADLYVSYDGGLGPAVASLPAPDGGGTIPKPTETGASVPDQAATWAARNGCDAAPAETAVAEDVTLLAFDCPPGDEVELYRVTDGGHTWPGSEFSSKVASVIGRTTMSISANELIWAFFRAHPLPQR